MAIREKVILEGEDRASQAFDKAGGNFEKFGKTLKKVAVAGGVAIAVRKIGQLTSKMVGLAIDAAEAESAFNTTFGRALPEASQFVEEFANKAGFANFELQQMLAVTGNVVQGIGATEAESAKMSETMARLAGDVASFSNASGGAQAVLAALQSAINGEREALKTYGLAVSETEVQERALQNTQKARADELTRLEKAQATIEIATEKAGKAIGDLDRTQDSAANTLRRLGGKAREAAADIGEALVPALEAVLPLLEDIIDDADQVGIVIGTTATVAIKGLAEAAPQGANALSMLAQAFGSVVHVGAGAATILGEIFTFGQADTTGLQNLAKVSAHGNDILELTRQLTSAQIPGATATDRYARALVELARRSDLSKEGMAALGAASGATAEEQLRALQMVREFAREQNWRTNNIDLLISTIGTLRGELSGVDMDAFNNDLVQAGDGGEHIAAAFGSATSATTRLTGEVGTLGDQSTETLDAIVEGARAAADAFRDDLAQGATDFITGFDELPKAVETTMNQFEENLTSRIEAQKDFWANLTVLAAQGFGDLAELIRQEGPAAAGLLEDMVADMSKAAELDEMIGDATTEIEDITNAYADALTGTSAQQALGAMGQYGEDLVDEIAAGIERGDLAGPLEQLITEAVNRITGQTLSFGGGRGGRRTPRARTFEHGTWEVPGRGPVEAVVHGGEIVIPPAGSRNRAQFAMELAGELGRVIGTGDGPRGPNVHIENFTVTVPAGATFTEAITAGVAAAALEEILS